LKVLSIIGTRPEAVKMAPVVQRLIEIEGIDSRLCVTAQHREMLDQTLELFELKPDIDLNLMSEDQSLAQLTAAIFEKLDPVIVAEQPDWILIQGDTTTVMAASILAYYHRVSVGHVEAGLRTSDKWRPFPEEINRRIAGVTADLHFAPTEWARQNLLAERVPDEQIRVTGNPVIDALQQISARPYDFSSGAFAGIPTERRLILVTAHRRENFGEPLERIFQALLEIARRYPDDVQIVYPVHLNPNVYKPAHQQLGQQSNITLIDPIDYLEMVQLMKRSRLVITDSGGLQEEAPALGIPVLVLREVTERPEAIEAGTARLVGTHVGSIVDQTCELLDNPDAYQTMAAAINPYGDGHAAEYIVDAILTWPDSPQNQ
jgi:UDP-N-acetylglucosamine 2-epimerase (non-hydrolysing)